MKKLLIVTCILLLCLPFVACENKAAETAPASPKVAAEPNAMEKKYVDLAARIVRDSVGVKPGDAVIINGGKHTIPLMEALAIETNKVGGFANMFLNSDRVDRSYYLDVPEKYLEIEPRYAAEWYKHTNVMISLPGTEDFKAAYADIPEERFAKANKASEFFAQIINDLPIRSIFINYPSKQDAAAAKLDFDTYEKIMWDAINADYKAISATGNSLKQLLQNSKTVRVTTPSGTDFSFSIGQRPVFVGDGIVTEEEAKTKMFITRSTNLPDGQVFTAPIETSANGKVVIPKTNCNFEAMTGVSFEFKNGKLENFKAQTGADCFNKRMAPYDGPKDVFGRFSIGLNPALKVIEDKADFRPGVGAGVINIGIGNNLFAGGSNKSSGGYGFPLTNATVQVDGKIIVKNGALVL